MHILLYYAANGPETLQSPVYHQASLERYTLKPLTRNYIAKATENLAPAAVTAHPYVLDPSPVLKWRGDPSSPSSSPHEIIKSCNLNSLAPGLLAGDSRQERMWVVPGEGEVRDGKRLKVQMVLPAARGCRSGGGGGVCVREKNFAESIKWACTGKSWDLGKSRGGGWERPGKHLLAPSPLS